MTGQPHTGAIVALIPALNDPARLLATDAHVTLAWFGEAAGVPEHLRQQIAAAVGEAAQGVRPFTSKVVRRAVLGDDQAEVLLLDAPELRQVRHLITGHPAVRQALELTEQHPSWLPHLTFDRERADDLPTEVHFDTVGYWTGDVHEDFALGGAVGFFDVTNFEPDDYLGDDTEQAGFLDDTEVAKDLRSMSVAREDDNLDTGSYFTDPEDGDDPVVAWRNRSRSAPRDSMLPRIDAVEDVPPALRFAHENPSARWYVIKRLAALELLSRVPVSWPERSRYTVSVQPLQEGGARGGMQTLGFTEPDGGEPIVIRNRNRALERGPERPLTTTEQRELWGDDPETDVAPGYWSSEAEQELTAEALAAAQRAALRRRVQWLRMSRAGSGPGGRVTRADKERMFSQITDQEG